MPLRKPDGHLRTYAKWSRKAQDHVQRRLDRSGKDCDANGLGSPLCCYM